MPYSKLTLYLIILINLNLFQCKSDQLVYVKTSSGLVKGQTIKVLNQKVNQFYGIPFAEPPIGSLRFAKPEPIRTPFEIKYNFDQNFFELISNVIKQGIIDGLHKKSACYQTGRDFPMSEDCLFLSIWSQNSNNYSLRYKPVMVWSHGDGFTTGTGFTYPGGALPVKEWLSSLLIIKKIGRKYIFNCESNKYLIQAFISNKIALIQKTTFTSIEVKYLVR